jgi:lipoate-protein ligase B
MRMSGLALEIRVSYNHFHMIMHCGERRLNSVRHSDSRLNMRHLWA